MEELTARAPERRACDSGIRGGCTLIQKPGAWDGNSGSGSAINWRYLVRIPFPCLTVGIALLAAGAMRRRLRAEEREMLLYVDNSLGDDISVIDLGTLKVVDTIKVGKEPHGLCAPADGRRLFTTIESEKSLKTIDTLTGKIVDIIPVDGQAQRVRRHTGWTLCWRAYTRRQPRGDRRYYREKGCEIAAGQRAAQLFQRRKQQRHVCVLDGGATKSTSST